MSDMKLGPCGHEVYGEHDHCAMIRCNNYINKCPNPGGAHTQIRTVKVEVCSACGSQEPHHVDWVKKYGVCVV